MEKKDNRPFDLTVNFPYDGSVRYENGSICCKVKYDDGSGDEIFGVEGVSSAFITYDDTLVINLSDGDRRMKNVAELMDYITNDIEFGDYAHNIRTYGRAYEEMTWYQCAALSLLAPKHQRRGEDMNKPLYQNDLTKSVAMICDGTYIVVDQHGTTTATYATLEELLSKNPEFLDWSVSRDLTA